LTWAGGGPQHEAALRRRSMENVLKYLGQNQSRFVHELCEYLAIPSVSAQEQHKPDMAAAAGWLVDHCRQLGLAARLVPTAGHPVAVISTPRRKGRPHFLVYGHYDVQPAEPLDLWKSPPFQPRVEGRSLVARGASDNKGQHFAHLKAVEAYLKTGTDLPCDLTFIVEGEEEVGSSHLAGFLQKNRRELECAAIVVSDTGMPDLKHPALSYGLRGIAAVEVKVLGPSRDVHSGIYGGSLDNPALVLCQMLASLRDARGRITIPGFYQGVVPLTAFERRQLARLPFHERAYRQFLGVPRLFGEKGFTPVEQRSARPTFEINGLTSGYQGQGSKTIVPAWASAKLTFRLVPNQAPDRIGQLVERHLKKICPPTARVEVRRGHGGEPYMFSPSGALAQAALRALRMAFGCEPVLMREGGSIPIINDFKKILGAEALLLGLGLPDDNPHSPNEKFSLDCFERGMALGALLWPELAGAAGRQGR
jgi:acetylornithine deacetylase/succinyl-diaminopimelate desuccinylase-like protein